MPDLEISPIKRCLFIHQIAVKITAVDGGKRGQCFRESLGAITQFVRLYGAALLYPSEGDRPQDRGGDEIASG